MSSTSKLLTPRCRIFPCALERIEACQRFVQRHRAAPVQKIQVEMIGVQAAKARLAGRNRATRARMLQAEPC